MTALVWSMALLLPLPFAVGPANPLLVGVGPNNYTSPYASDVQDAIPAPGLKKGMALSPTGQQQCYDAQAYNMEKFGWWYSWRQNVTTSWDMNYWDCGAASLGQTNFVPMLKNTEFTTTEELAITYDDSPYLFGFNEPYGSHSTATGADAFTAESCTAGMQAVITKAESYTPPKIIIAPTVNPKGSAMDWYTPFQTAAQSTMATGQSTSVWSKFGYMSMHYYTCEPWRMLKGIDQVYEAFGLPIWVTEFNCAGSQTNPNTGQDSTAADNLGYMQEVLPILEAHPHVVRYSWYTNRNTAMPQCPLMETTCGGTECAADAPTFTTLGTWYNNYAHGERSVRPTGNTISGNLVLQVNDASLLTGTAAHTAIANGIAASITDVTAAMVTIDSVTAARRLSEGNGRRLNTQATAVYTIAGAPASVTATHITSATAAFTTNINSQLTAANIAVTITSTAAPAPTVTQPTPAPTTPAPTPAPPATPPSGLTSLTIGMSTDLVGVVLLTGLLANVL